MDKIGGGSYRDRDTTKNTGKAVKASWHST